MAGLAANKTPTIGIDFGTMYSCVGVFHNGNVDIIPNDLGNTVTSNYVAFTETEQLFGEAARNQTAKNLENTIFDVKRVIGRKFTDQSVQSDIKHWPFKVINQEGKPQLQTEYIGEEKTFSPEQITSMFLAKMKESAEVFLGMKTSNAVITVPAYFNDFQRQAIKEAGVLAGLNILQILSEPTAACLAYGYGIKDREEEKNVLVFDLGSRTCNVSLMLIEDGIFEIKDAKEDTQSGGDVFVDRLVDHLSTEFKQKFNKDLSIDKPAMYRLRTAAERAKRTLSTFNQAIIEIDALFEGIDFYDTITRGKFENLCDDLFQNCIRQIEHVLQTCKLDKTNLDGVLLVGGSTRTPKIKELLRTFFVDKDLQQSINPDEAIARGAAKYGDIFANTDHSVTCCCCFAALSLGVETSDGTMKKVIKRHAQLPTRATHIFTTESDDQTTVSIRVYEGERTMTKDNHKVSVFELSGIPPALRGVPKIQVTFDVDANDILKVTAEDQGSGLSNSITVTDYGSYERLSKADIEWLLSDAEIHKAEDEADQKRIAVKSDLEALPAGSDN